MVWYRKSDSVNQCIFTLRTDFILIRFETTEPWPFFEEVAPTRRRITRWVVIRVIPYGRWHPVAVKWSYMNSYTGLLTFYCDTVRWASRRVSGTYKLLLQNQSCGLRLRAGLWQDRSRSWSWSYTFGLGLGLGLTVLVMVLILYCSLGLGLGLNSLVLFPSLFKNPLNGS